MTDAERFNPAELEWRRPLWLFLALSWLFAGLLNPLCVVVIVLAKVGIFPIENAIQFYWMTATLCALAAALGLPRLRSMTATTYNIFLIAMQQLIWFGGGTLVVMSIMFLPAAPYILFYGIPIVIVIGVPAALFGALAIRLTLFEWQPVKRRSEF